MAEDVLSDLLKTVRLTGAAYFEVEAAEPWVAEQPPSDMVLRKVLPGASNLIAYHVVTEGRCVTTMLDSGKVLELEAGEVIVYPRGDAHVMSSRPGMRAAPVAPEEFEAVAASRLPFSVNYGNGPATARLVCGFLACDAAPFNPLIEALPPMIKSGDPRGGDNGWLGQFIRVARMESANLRAGGESILAKLSELMFIEVVRRHLESLPAGQSGWLAGLRDPMVGKALALMHGKPAQRWTIEELAKQVGASRSVLAERFTQVVGTPPLHYLAKWRMQIALGMLGGGNANIATIAAEIGYDSEAAFSRAFKKLMGKPPSAWRRKPNGAGAAA
jgi:AraC-like DNA-binding protein